MTMDGQDKALVHSRTAVVQAKKMDLTFQTLTRGHVAVRDGEIRTQEGHGKFVKREGNTSTNKASSTWKDLTAPRPIERTGIPVTGV